MGHGGSYVKHIQQETGCRVQIKGRGSGYLEGATNRESDEDMYLHVAYVSSISHKGTNEYSANHTTADLMPAWSKKPRSSVRT